MRALVCKVTVILLFSSLGHASMVSQDSFDKLKAVFNSEKIESASKIIGDGYRREADKKLLAHHILIAKNIFRKSKVEVEMTDREIVVKMNDHVFLKFDIEDAERKVFRVNGVNTRILGVSYKKDFQRVNYGLSFSASSLMDLFIPSAQAVSYKPGERVFGTIFVLLAAKTLRFEYNEELDVIKP